MDNRFERLYGYAQRSLVKSIRKELGDDESLTMGILLFHSFSESFYYESTVKNTLLFPNKIKKLFVEKEIWTYELMFYLAKYMSLPKTKSYIRDLISDNSTLSKKDASVFSITFEDYEQFKKAWLEWLDDLHFTLVDSYSELCKSTLNELFYFANYLLTIIKYSAYTTYYNPKDGAFREHIYRIIVGETHGDDSSKTDKKTAELNPHSDYTWNRHLDSQISYSQLALVLEICFKQPFTVRDKIDDIQSILHGQAEGSQKTMEFCSMAKPLQYNGEFQGIIYVTKNREKGTFSEADFEKFKKAINDFHIESIIYSSRFDTARLLLENVTENDLNIHPLIKVLNCQHLFSASPLGVAVIPETGCFLRYRENEFMQTKKINLPINSVFEFINEVANVNFSELINRNHYYWLDIDSSIEKKFGKRLNLLLGISEDLFIKSITCMKFVERGHECYYFLFSSNHINNHINSVKQSYALRTHSNVSKLIDTILSSKRVFDIRYNLMNEFQLNFFHDEKNFILTQKQRLLLALDEPSKSKMAKCVRGIIDDLEIKETRYTDFVKLLREQFDDRSKSYVSKDKLKEILSKVQEGISDSKIKLLWEFMIEDNEFIETYEKSLEYLIKEITTNAIKQYGNYSGKNIKSKKILVRVERISDKSKQFEGFSFYVHSAGTEIPESIIEIAGEERINNGSNNSSSGLGFMIMKDLLKRMNASRFGNKYFQIINEKPTSGVSIRFSLPHKIVK